MIRHRRTILALVASLSLLALAGCQFPGAGVSVSFTSPADGARITGVSHPYDLAVTVQVTGATPDSFTLTDNGVKVASSNISVSGSTYTASVPLADGANALVATATAAGFTYTAMRHVYYPFLALTDGQAASTVMGETSFTTAPSAQQTGIDLLYQPRGAAALVGSYHYIPDSGNHRVVGYKSLPSSPAGANFDILLGRTAGTWTDGKPTTVSRTSLSAPAAVAAAGSQLAVADTGFNRVLLWSGTPTTSATLPSVVLGQSGFVSSTAQCAAYGMNHPGSVVEAGGKLIVADTDNNRVLIWNRVPTASGTPPDLILGRSDCTPGTTSATTFDHPSAVWSDGTRLLVADTGNNRVLVWTAFPTAANKAADLVIGQATMAGNTVQPADDTSVSSAVHTGLSGPAGVDSNGNQVFIADTGYNRVLVFDTFPTTNGARASRVLGQPTLAGTAPNNGGIGAATLSGPQGVRAFDGYLIVADTLNSRELLYRP